EAAGAFETLATEIAVANTEGQFCWAPSTQASLTTVVTGGEGGSGFAEVFAGRIAEVDPEAVGRRAAEKARASQNPRDLDAGRYPVVLEPSAVATPVGLLVWIGCGGKTVLGARWAFGAKEGGRVAPPPISIYDNPTPPPPMGI